MKEQEIKKKLEAVAISVLEQSAYTFADPGEFQEFRQLAELNMIEATIEYSGECNGSLKLVLPAELCVEIHCNMLGIDPSDCSDIEQSRDAAKEILNIICGHFVTDVFGDTRDIWLSTPEVKEMEAEAIEANLPNDQTVTLLADDMPVLLTFTIASGEYEHKSINS